MAYSQGGGYLYVATQGKVIRVAFQLADTEDFERWSGPVNLRRWSYKLVATWTRRGISRMYCLSKPRLVSISAAKIVKYRNLSYQYWHSIQCAYQINLDSCKHYHLITIYVFHLRFTSIWLAIPKIWPLDCMPTKTHLVFWKYDSTKKSNNIFQNIITLAICIGDISANFAVIGRVSPVLLYWQETFVISTTSVTLGFQRHVPLLQTQLSKAHFANVLPFQCRIATPIYCKCGKVSKLTISILTTITLCLPGTHKWWAFKKPWDSW